MLLTTEQKYELDKEAMRLAFDYAMAGHGGSERGEMVAKVKFETMIETLKVLGLEYRPKNLGGIYIQSHNLFAIGDALYKAGYRREGNKLVKRISNVLGEI